MMKKTLILVLLLIGWGSLPEASEPSLKPEEVKIVRQAICLPVGRFVLIQRQDLFCAIIFLSTERNESGISASYQLFWPSEGWRQERGKISYRTRLTGLEILRNLFHHEDSIGRVEKLSLDGLELLCEPFETHAVIYFGTSPDNLDPAVKIAPTPWRRMEEVNLKEPRLKWYGSGSREQNIRIDELLK